jgi:hypothetical protein
VTPLRLQGTYYLATGIWPIVSLRSFVALTGPKHDTWLVRTFGALVAAVGFALLRAPADDETASRLAVGSAATLAASEVVFVARRRISPIYLGDAVVEAVLAASVVISRSISRSQSATRSA